MNIGDAIETAIWLDGRETRGQRTRYDGDVRKAIADLCSEQGVVHGPVVFSVLKPGDERVPPVPDHISGPDVRLLHAEAKVVGIAMEVNPSRFVSDLDPKDVARLREITRRGHRKANPHDAPLTDDECDAMIEALGPDAAADAVRSAVNAGAIH